MKGRRGGRREVREGEGRGISVSNEVIVSQSSADRVYSLCDFVCLLLYLCHNGRLQVLVCGSGDHMTSGEVRFKDLNIEILVIQHELL